jgi:hypothetical protein
MEAVLEVFLVFLSAIAGPRVKLDHLSAPPAKTGRRVSFVTENRVVVNGSRREASTGSTTKLGEMRLAVRATKAETRFPRMSQTERTAISIQPRPRHGNPESLQSHLQSRSLRLRLLYTGEMAALRITIVR